MTGHSKYIATMSSAFAVVVLAINFPLVTVAGLAVGVVLVLLQALKS